MHSKNVTTNQGKVRVFVIPSKVALNFRGVATRGSKGGRGHCVLKWVLRGHFLGIKMPK